MFKRHRDKLNMFKHHKDKLYRFRHHHRLVIDKLHNKLNTDKHHKKLNIDMHHKKLNIDKHHKELNILYNQNQEWFQTINHTVKKYLKKQLDKWSKKNTKPRN